MLLIESVPEKRSYLFPFVHLPFIGSCGVDTIGKMEYCMVY